MNDRATPLHGTTMEFIDVVLPISLPKTLTYRIPPQYVGRMVRGSRVLVPLGHQKIVAGLVDKIHKHPPKYPTKEIVEVMDKTPIVHSTQLQFFHWLATYYLCTLGEVMLAALPHGFRLSSQTSLQLHPEIDLTITSLSKQAEALIKVLKTRTSITYKEAATALGLKNIHALIKSLLQQKVILRSEDVKERYKPKSVKKIRLHTTYLEDESALKELFTALAKSHKQREVLLQYVAKVPIKPSILPERCLVDKRSLLQTGISAAALKTLLRKQVLVEEEATVARFASVTSDRQPLPVLSPAQSSAYASITQQFKQKEVVLLHGITASGKTEIYIHLIQSVLQEGGQVLYLLPEIALTTQIVGRLRIIFGDKVSVYHSKYTNHERVEVWNDVLHGKCTFILGTRSAIFLPLKHLRLIIVDEEHDTSYKQLEAMPRYHARDAALALAKCHHAKVLLGSATPSIESYYHARQGKYRLVSLKERFSKVSLPEIHLEDLRIARAQKTLREDFTKKLLEALRKTLERKEQAIVFQNRRGYAPYITCGHCAWVPRCTQCSVSLTYHQYSNHLRCHYCGYQTPMPPACQDCGAHQLKNVGFGTEKLEETLQWCFPGKEIRRMDLDTTRGKYSYEQLIQELEQGHIDILVGTQMLTKGLDFRRVTLVGVLDIDRLLYFPDFRANERCFQLLIQVSGRAGRGEKRGSVIVQTSNPEHPILKEIVQHNYEHMYARELRDRQQFLYPPYTRLIKITLKHKHKAQVDSVANTLAERLRQQLGSSILGPQAPLVAKIRQHHLVDIWVKIRKGTVNLTATKQLLIQERKHILNSKLGKSIRIVFDVDPI